MPNNTISQVQVNDTTYDLLDANTLSAVSAIESRVKALEDSVGNKIEIFSSLQKMKFYKVAEGSSDERAEIKFETPNQTQKHLSFSIYKNYPKLTATSFSYDNSSSQTEWEMGGLTLLVSATGWTNGVAKNVPNSDKYIFFGCVVSTGNNDTEATLMLPGLKYNNQIHFAGSTDDGTSTRQWRVSMRISGTSWTLVSGSHHILNNNGHTGYSTRPMKIYGIL